MPMKFTFQFLLTNFFINISNVAHCLAGVSFGEVSMWNTPWCDIDAANVPQCLSWCSFGIVNVTQHFFCRLMHIQFSLTNFCVDVANVARRLAVVPLSKSVFTPK